MLLQKQHAALLLTVLATGLHAQSFEVASVKAVPNGTGRFTMTGGPGTPDPGRIAYLNIPLRRVLLAAYDVSNYQISAPDWFNSLRYDITATLPAGATKGQFQAMLRNLLASRFQMASHMEAKELPIYAMLPAKNGFKLRAVTPDLAAPENQLAEVKPGEGKDGFPEVHLPSPGIVIETRNGRARITAKEVSLAKLADFLSSRLDRPVLDNSSVAGIYTFQLYFRPEGADGGDPSEAGIFVALQEQLGLRLDARRSEVQMLMIDRAEKVPVEN